MAPFVLARQFGAMMLQQRAGSIVNVASIAGVMGVSDRSAYNASKHGLIGLTRTLAAEWGGRGVRCNAVCPGWVKTEMDAADQARGTYTDVDITGRNPMGGLQRPTTLRVRLHFWLIRRRAASSTGRRCRWMAAGRWTGAGRACG